MSKNSVPQSRIKFFKDSHFTHDKPQFPIDANTSMKQSFYSHDVKNRSDINDGNNAYRLRHHVHDYGQIGKQASNMVPDNSVRYKWIQPVDTDNGRTASMGFFKH